MHPIVLLVADMPQSCEIAQQLDHLPIEWLGAHDHGEVVRQLETEPRIECVIMGGGLDDRMRGDLVGLIAQMRPDVCIHLKDRASGPHGLAPFAAQIVENILLRKREREAA
ncbi:hypothetical protein NNA36_19015 [Shimia sp. CNT1-13L.2]|uniref:hypothetical protein n=1 Tax=Shimia sp. CNT1-13L.2 TaxID=2959663 RepID=UPI0020CE717A|nr:hypothetical protein [Shimia sp. CNT1-13L.2]MCP9484057.1 hypothetical protein [Shimia sp. CNT1-13L.2]